MPQKTLTVNPNYVAMVRGVRELHRLLAAGQDDSPEADAVRDATDGPWEALSEAERERVGNLSEDLYSLAEPPPVPQPMTVEAQSNLSEILQARKRGEWDEALALLRKWRAHYDAALASYLCGSIWLEAGDPETAVLFLQHATTLRPESNEYHAALLEALALVAAKPEVVAG